MNEKDKKVLGISAIAIVAVLFVFGIKLISLFVNGSSDTGRRIRNTVQETTETSRLHKKKGTVVYETLNTGEDLDFPEDQYPYRAMLSEEEKTVYNQLYANIVAHNNDFELVNPISSLSVDDVISAVLYDHPELFWYTGHSEYIAMPNSGAVIDMSIEFLEFDDFDAAKAEFDSNLQKIVEAARTKGDPYSMELYVHDTLAKKTTYDSNNPMNQTAYSAIVQGRSVCAGYSKAFQLVMHELGIPCYYITGKIEGSNHAWNIVRINGDFYNVDVLWDDNLVLTHKYFNITDERIYADHERDSIAKELPACDSEEFKYKAG